jgi:hypothetical protein
MEMDMDMANWLEDEDPDRRPTTLLGKIRRFFDRDRSGGWFTHGDGASFWSGWGGCGGGGAGCDGGGCGGGGCSGGGCGSC